MKSVDITIAAGSPDTLSVSVDYRLDAAPIVKKWHADRSVVDKICGGVLETVQAALCAPADAAEAAGHRGDIAGKLRSLGLALFQEILKDECDRISTWVAEAARSSPPDQLYLIFRIDKQLGYLPLELMHDGQTFLSHAVPLGRVIYAEDASFPQRLPRREPYSVVVVGDPSEDPSIAKDVEREIDAVRNSFMRRREFALKIALGAEADQKHILEELPGATIFHFTGHGVASDKKDLAGIKLGAGKILSGYSLMGLQNAPTFAFLNTCTPDARDTWKSSLGLVETLLRRGSLACVASLWDLRSESAAFIAERFYAHLIAGETFGEALRRARGEAVNRLGPHEPTWAAYALYGDPRLGLGEGPRKTLQVTASGAVASEAPKHRGKGAAVVLAAVLVIAALILIPVAIKHEGTGVPGAPVESTSGAASRVTSEAPVRPAVGYLIVQSTPKDARVRIDGREAGVTPYTVEIRVGTHDVVIEKRGYKRWEASVEVKQSPRATVDARLEKLK
jgi:hypothetical protein